jgi:hypothetical protein
VDRKHARQLRSRRGLGSRTALPLIVIVVALVVAASLVHLLSHSDTYQVPTQARLADLSIPDRIVAIAESQVGYATHPSDSYCNKFSAYWDAGTANCPTGEMSEEWCADFAAWAWQLAGAHFTYGYGSGQINGAAASFYEWGIANGEWHPATTSYVPSPGDVAVYGLRLGADPYAAHVAIVTNDATGTQGPDVINGDGDQTGFSVVETGNKQTQVHTSQGVSTLSGYVSPYT